MPSVIKVPADSSTESNNDESPCSKKVKTYHNASEAQMRMRYTQVWGMKNRVDYHPPLLRQPYGVKFISDSIVTTEGLWPHSRIQIFDLNGHSVKVIGQGRVLPFGITSDNHGHIVVTDHRDRTVRAFTQQGQEAFSWETNKFDWPNGIARTDSDNFIIADWSKGRIYLCDAYGREISSFSTVTSDNLSPGAISCPDYVVIDAHQRIITSDTYDRTVKLFDQSGRFLFKIGNDCGPGHLNQPKGVATDDKNNIFIADWENDCIKMYDSSGMWIDDIVTRAETIQHPLAISTNNTGDRLVLTEHILNGSPSLKMFRHDL